jgi:hypothetical protein
LAESGDAGGGLREEAAGLGGVVWFEEFAEVEGVADCFEEDFGVGVGGFAGEALEVAGEGGQFCGQGGAVCLCEFAADGRDEPFWFVGGAGRGEGEQEGRGEDGRGGFHGWRLGWWSGAARMWRRARRARREE